MTTAMAVYHSGGEAGRCDANCHEAQEPICDCCCGGRLHGCGSSERAIEMNTEDWFGSLEAAEQWAKQNGIESAKIKAPQVRGRRSLKKLLQPKRAAEREERLRAKRLGIVPGQLPLLA